MAETKKTQTKDPQAPPSGEAMLRAYDDRGVDLTLIDWMLSLTPEQRLRVLQQSVRSLTRLRDAKTSS